MMQHGIQLIGTLTIPTLLGDTPTVAVPELPVISQRLLQETSAWDSIASVQGIMLQVQTTPFSASMGVQSNISAVEATHLSHLIQTIRTVNTKPLGLHLEPNNISTAVALWQLGLINWVMLAPFHQSVLHPVFGFLQPYPLEILCQQWKIPLTPEQPAWLVINLQHWRLEAILHHWQYLMAHPWVHALQLTPQQATALHQHGLWHAQTQTHSTNQPSPAIWLLDAPTTWIAEHSHWSTDINLPIQYCLHQLALRPLQTTNFWPYTTDTTDPRRIEAYQQQLHAYFKVPPTTTVQHPTATATTTTVAKCPFGYG
jgi:hypothetical protein